MAHKMYMSGKHCRDQAWHNSQMNCWRQDSKEVSYIAGVGQQVPGKTLGAGMCLESEQHGQGQSAQDRRTGIKS